MNALLKGGPMDGTWIEINAINGERGIEYADKIAVYKMPEIVLKIEDALKPIPEGLEPEVLHYGLVIRKNQAPLYEHLQTTS